MGDVPGCVQRPHVAARHGWGEYCTAPAFHDAVANTYSYNNHSLLRIKEVIKDAVDPNGILSAGRYGIWPRHLREITLFRRRAG